MGPGFLKPKTLHILLNDAMFQQCFEKTSTLMFLTMFEKKHRLNDASNDVNRPPLVTGPLKGKLKIQITNKHGGKTS